MIINLRESTLKDEHFQSMLSEISGLVSNFVNANLDLDAPQNSCFEKCIGAIAMGICMAIMVNNDEIKSREYCLGRFRQEAIRSVKIALESRLTIIKEDDGSITKKINWGK